MTAIVGLVHEGTVFLGGDSAAAGNMNIYTRREPKVFRSDQYIIGYTTSFRMGQIIRHAFKPPMLASGDAEVSDEDLMGFMATEFIRKLKLAFKDGGWLESDKGRDTGGQMLIGVAGRLFQIESDFQVGESALGYDAVGSGNEVALGSLHATSHTEFDPQKRLELALQAAEEFVSTCRRPFHFVSLEK